MKEVALQFRLIATTLKGLRYKVTCFKSEADSHASVVWGRAGGFFYARLEFA